MTWTCHVCLAPFKSWAAAERHAQAEGHGRIEIHTEGRTR